MFVGREKDINYLEEQYRTGEFRFIVLYGRRRVGKTALISEFVNGKDAIFFAAQEYDNETALLLFSEKVYAHFGLEALPPFDNWNRAFEFIAARSLKKQTILVIDEFPYLARANRSIPSILQNIIDHQFKKSKIFLIICGSSMSFMERGVLSEKSPLYGRLTSQMEILPFDYLDSGRFFPRYSLEDKAAAFGITGGIPQYLIQIKDTRSLKSNIVSAVLSKPSSLYEEPRNLLKEELRTPRLYNMIIEAAARGQTRLNDIATKTGIPRDKCLKYIRSLLELHILERETPVGENAGKRGIYRLTDNFFKFWYSFVFENTELVEQGNGALLWDTIVVPALSEYMGFQVFEDICKTWLRRNNGLSGKAPGKLPFVFSSIGRWWGSNPKTKEQVEIDILACGKKQALFGECKWTNRAATPDALEGLEEKAALFSRFTEKYFAVFSKSGFSAGLKKAAQGRQDVLLVDLKTLFAG
jgi:AAA+ ATPase superfamily predicted ATPase